MADTLATSFGVLNYSGMLFNKGNTRCPLSSIIGGRAKTTNHVEFVTGQEYTTGGGTQPAISETASLTAPEATVVTRTQKTNVTQIFQESVGISYAKQSNMGTLSGLNVAGQQANPINELDFQVAAKMQKVNRDIEFTFIQGTYNKATSDATVNKTRGLVEAITTNVTAMANKPLGLWDIADMVKKVYGANAPTDGLCLWCDAVTLFQVNADAVQNGLTVVPAAREINGIALSSVVTPIGVVYLYLGECLPAGTALLLNLNVISLFPVRVTSSWSLLPRLVPVRSISSSVRSALTTAPSGITASLPVSLPSSPLPLTAVVCMWRMRLTSPVVLRVKEKF